MRAVRRSYAWRCASQLVAGARRGVLRGAWVGIAVALPALSVTAKPQAATVTLDAQSCSLELAVLAINQGEDQSGCPAAVGAYGDDDTIVIPSGKFSIKSPITIEKSLSIVGSGPCSTLVTTSRASLAYAIGIVGAELSVQIEGIDLSGRRGNSTTGIYVDGSMASAETPGVNLELLSTRVHGFNLSGILNKAGGDVSADSCFIYGNTNPGSGGGVFNEGSSTATARFSANNTSIGFNTAMYGGGVYNHNGIAQLMSTTFESNHATVTGGAMYAAYDQFFRIYQNAEHDSVFINNSADNGGYSIVDGNMAAEFTPAIACGNSAPYCDPTQVPDGAVCPQN